MMGCGNATPWGSESDYGQHSTRGSRCLRLRSDAQPGLMHQRNDLAAEVLEVGNEVVEVHLDAVTACPLEANEPINDLLGRADQVDVAANHPLVSCRLLPGRLVAASKRGMEVVGGNRTGYEDEVRMAHSVGQACCRGCRVHQNAAAVHRLRRDEGILRLPKAAVDREFIVFQP